MGKLILQCDFWPFFTIFKSHRTKGSHGQIILFFFVLILELKINQENHMPQSFKNFDPIRVGLPIHLAPT